MARIPTNQNGSCYCKLHAPAKKPARGQFFNEDTGNSVVLVTNVSFESSIGVEVVVIVEILETMSSLIADPFKINVHSSASLISILQLNGS